jgi:hypothetical protein
MVNELEMSSEDVAIALGHQDGGNLVRRLYGHRNKSRALDRIVGAYADAANGHAAIPPIATACRKARQVRHEQPTLFDLPQTAHETAHDPINRQQ